MNECNIMCEQMYGHFLEMSQKCRTDKNQLFQHHIRDVSNTIGKCSHIFWECRINAATAGMFIAIVAATIAAITCIFKYDCHCCHDHSDQQLLLCKLLLSLPRLPYCKSHLPTSHNAKTPHCVRSSAVVATYMPEQKACLG